MRFSQSESRHEVGALGGTRVPTTNFSEAAQICGILAAVKIRAYQSTDEAAVVALWRRCGLLRPQNDPLADIQRKLGVSPELFLVGTVDSELITACMAGYDGHRGSIFYFGVDPNHQKSGYGRQMMDRAEALLRERGCPKINLLVRTSNREVIEFYERLGFCVDEVVSLGKRLIADGAPV